MHEVGSPLVFGRNKKLRGHRLHHLLFREARNSWGSSRPVLLESIRDLIIMNIRWNIIRIQPAGVIVIFHRSQELHFIVAQIHVSITSCVGVNLLNATIRFSIDFQCTNLDITIRKPLHENGWFPSDVHNQEATSTVSRSSARQSIKMS